MNNKMLRVRVDNQILIKIEYLMRINKYKNMSDTVRKIIEKEYRKEINNG